MEKFHSS